MRIEDDDKAVNTRSDAMARIQAYTERQDEVAKEVSAEALKQEEARRLAVDGQAEPPPQIDGAHTAQNDSQTDKHDDELGVKSANAQQDRGEKWQDYSSTKPTEDLPPAVESHTQSEARKEIATQVQKISVGDIMTQMRINNRKIDA